MYRRTWVLVENQTLTHEDRISTGFGVRDEVMGVTHS
jgi:hypothetical protein